MKAGDVTKLLGVIANAFPGRFVLPKEQDKLQAVIATWARMLEDVDGPEGFAALEEYLSAETHPPAIGSLRSIVAKRRLNLPDDAAAWEEVRLAMNRRGRDHEPEWSHPAIAGAVSAMGWVSLCNSTLEQEPTVRAQFRGYLNARAESASQAENIGALRSAVEKRRLGGESAGDAVKRLLGGIKTEEGSNG